MISTIVPGDHSFGVSQTLAAGALWLVSVGGYFIGFWAVLGRTPGMRLMRLEVRSADGGEIGWGRASLRFIGLVDAPSQGGRVAILSDGRGNVFYGKEGDIIEGRYRLLRVGPDAADIAFTDGRGRQTIRLSGQ